MVKLNIITRTDRDLSRETKFDLHRVHHTVDSNIHQLQQPREFQRALIGAKVQKIFSKPFVKALDAHTAPINCMAKAYSVADRFISGAADGEVILWDLKSRMPRLRVQAFEDNTKSVSFDDKGKFFIASGDDYQINLYNCAKFDQEAVVQGAVQPEKRIVSQTMVQHIELAYGRKQFISAGERVELWDLERASPIERFKWGNDSITKARFSPGEPDLLICTALDRGLFLYDTRQKSLLAKVVLMNKSSTVCWNPMEPFNFVAGNEDGNCYGFDMRKLEKPRMIYKDHIGAVLDLDFSPSGKNFTSASFDKTIRIFDVRDGKSKEAYHGKRMQKVFSVLWTSDDKYILSGSEDTNVRIWKSTKYAIEGNVNLREQKANQYRDKLVEKYSRAKPVRQVMRSHLPKYILNDRKKKQIMKESRFRKEQNRMIFNEEIYEEPKPEKERKVVKFEE